MKMYQIGVKTVIAGHGMKMTSDKDFLYEDIMISSILPLSLTFYQSFKKNSMIQYQK